jgi:hypothetical protein
MAPAMKVSKMKQVCSASPGKFASALLDILDGSILESPERSGSLPVATPEPEKIQKKGAEGKVAVRKRPAAAAAKEESPVKKAKVTKEDQIKIEEEKLTFDRKKELSKMEVAKLKEMTVRKGLECGKKMQMIENIVTSESKARENVRRHKTNAKDVVSKKREEFAGKTQAKLKETLRAYGLLIGGTKPEMVERLLATWKEQGEIEKVLAGMAFQARKAELHALDKVTLYEMCCKRGVDALSKDVLIDRLLMHESVEIWQEVVEARRQIV